jgi:DNA-binding NarL/FixJ family response regulator
VRMPRMGGIEATRAIRQLFPITRIIVLSVSDEQDDLYSAFKAGANGYLLKEVSIEEVADAVRKVFAGESLFPAALASKLLADFSGQPKALDDPVPVSPRLTEREVAVLKLVARGDGNAAIASQLSVSESSVRNHVANILTKLQQRSQIEPAT